MLCCVEARVVRARLCAGFNTEFQKFFSVCF
jgi:hypothetical protein